MRLVAQVVVAVVMAVAVVVVALVMAVAVVAVAQPALPSAGLHPAEHVPLWQHLQP
jgi:hypothetical protein